MASSTQNKLTESDVLTKVNAKVRECVGWYDSKLSKERERVLKNYNGTLPRRQREGSSSFVSTDVYDSVESMKAQLLETFSGNSDDMVSFDPSGPNDVDASRVATAYCDYVIWRENPGFQICNDVIHDGLTARVGVVKVYWDKQHKDTDHTFEGLPYEHVQGLASQPDIPELKAEADDATGLFKGTMARRANTSQVRIDPMPPEEFLISPRARSIQLADVSAHRTRKTKAELLDRGYDKKKVETINGDDEKGLELAPEALARNAVVESAQALDDPIQDELQKVMIYEAYVRMDLRDGKGARLYRMVYSGSVMFEEPEEVDRAPFIEFVPLPIPYLFYGNNFAQRVIPYQNARTVLTRSILDHATITTNPRWTVLKGGLLNPKELLDNRLGGIVNISRPDAVGALEQQNLNPFVFQTLEMLKGNKEESTGISALSQGLNKDAISTQNSSALVDNLVSLSQQRQKIIARNFAYRFLIPLYLEVYRLVLENQDKEQAKIIEVAGQFIPVTTEAWKERTTCRASLHLGYGEKDREVAKYDMLYKSLSADPAIAPMFKPKNRYKLITDGMKKAGFQNFTDYIDTPEQSPPPPPDPLKVQEVQAKVTSANAAMTQAQSAQTKNTRLADVAAIKVQLAEINSHFEHILKTQESTRMDAETTNRIDVSQREIALAEAEPAQDSIVVSPH